MIGRTEKRWLGLALLMAGCAGGPAPVRFPARPGAATISGESEENLVAAGYVCLGSLEASIEKERCAGSERAPGVCETAKPGRDSASRLLADAGKRGGELVRLTKQEVPTTAPWVEHECEGITYGLGVSGIPLCAQKEVVVGIRRLAVSSGTMWRRAPELISNMLLARAIEAGDAPRVAALLPRVAALDVYLDQPPLVLAAKNGNVAILRQLLAAGAKAGKETALFTAVERADEPVARELLASGASVEARDPATRDRPLHVATSHKASPAMLRLLLEAGADVNALNALDQMPLQCAIVSCDVEAARILVAAGASSSWALGDDVPFDLARQRCAPEVAAISELLAHDR